MSTISSDAARMALTNLLINARELGDQLSRTLLEAERIARAEGWVGAAVAIAPGTAAIVPLIDGLAELLHRADGRLGLAWWNQLSQAERIGWMHAAGDTGVAADAWEVYKRSEERAGA